MGKEKLKILRGLGTLESVPMSSAAKGFGFAQMDKQGRQVFIPRDIALEHEIGPSDLGARVRVTYVAQHKNRFLCTGLRLLRDATGDVSEYDAELSGALDRLDEALDAVDEHVDTVRGLIIDRGEAAREGEL